jgi:opacity protein-like surface antigen
MKLFTAVLSLTALCLFPGAAVAQERMPAQGSYALGVDVGALIPKSDELSNSLLLNVLYEYYVTPRVSLRGDFGWANPSFSGGAVDSLMQLPLRVNVNYNWEGGRWHPFVGAGVGLYFLQFRSELPSDDNRDTRFGVSTGGGVEYFFRRNMTIKGEGRYHAINDARGEEPSGTTLTVGLKSYF